MNASPPAGSDFPCTPVAIAWHARQAGDAIAVVQGATRISYARLAADVARAVVALQRHGVESGMLVGVENRPERYLGMVLLLACEAIGAAATAMPREAPEHADPVLARCDVLLAAQHRPGGRPAAPVIPPDWLAGLAAEPLPREHLHLLQCAFAPERVVRIFRTSGTTGRPKAIAITHRMLQSMIAMHMERVPADVLARPRALCLYGFGVRAAETRVAGILQHGGCVFCVGEDRAGPLLATGEANYAMLMVGDAERIARAIPPGAGSGAAPLIELMGARAGPRLRQLLAERLGARVTTRYSSNETGIVADLDADNVGTLVAGASVRIVDAAGQDLPVGQRGQILIRTATMADGYYEDPELTRKAFVDGWFRSSDIGYLPAPGRLVVLGRADAMLNIGGVKLPVGPLEDVLRQEVAGVADIALLSTADPNGVEWLVVALEIPGGVPPPELHRQVAAALAIHTRQFALHVLPFFPRTGNGKIRRDVIELAYRRRQGWDGP
jgi:acyl-coenzyme A synthetase/AMP-(fatty) acid ligase